MVWWVFEHEDERCAEAAELPLEARSTDGPDTRSVSPRTRVRRKPRHKTGNVGRSGVVTVEIKNLEHAIAEIKTARDELVAIQAADLDRHERNHARIEPMSRLVLVRRYLDEITTGHDRRRL